MFLLLFAAFIFQWPLGVRADTALLQVSPPNGFTAAHQPQYGVQRSDWSRGNELLEITQLQRLPIEPGAHTFKDQNYRLISHVPFVRCRAGSWMFTNYTVTFPLVPQQPRLYAHQMKIQLSDVAYIVSYARPLTNAVPGDVYEFFARICRRSVEPLSFAAPPGWIADKSSAYGNTPPSLSNVRWWHRGQGVIGWTAFPSGMPAVGDPLRHLSYPRISGTRVVGTPTVSRNVPCAGAVLLRYDTRQGASPEIRHHMNVFVGRRELLWSLYYSYTEAFPDRSVVAAMTAYCKIEHAEP